MKFKKWNYGVWAVMLSELVAFGENTFVYYGVAALIIALAVVNFTIRHSETWKKAKLDLKKANPLSPGTFAAFTIIMTLAAVGVPYLSGDISIPLFLLVAFLWVE